MRETRAEKNYISKEGFRRWVRVMNKQFLKSKDAIVYYVKNTTYIYLRSKAGVARTSPNDTYNREVGIAYAWARCTGQPVYYENEPMPVAGDLIRVKFVNTRVDTVFLFTFVAEGVDNYCFRRKDGSLVCYDKDKIKSIKLAK